MGCWWAGGGGAEGGLRWYQALVGNSETHERIVWGCAGRRPHLCAQKQGHKGSQSELRLLVSLTDKKLSV